MKLSLKWTAVSVGGIIAIAHIGLLGYLIREQPERVVEVPTINIPHGPYSSYKIEAGKDGYSIEYHADDPKVLQSERSLDMNKERTGFFGGGREQRSEYRRDQYTREGTRNLGGEIGEVGKIGGVSAECIAADAGARSQGAMAGTSIAAGVIVPAVSSVPYIGWLAGGWALLLGQNIGSEAGSQVNSFISDC
mgnify:CR=1 FL=1|tara:strand:- start:79 stop:654 length:576 start_codon:yes stop_codon:yes gene_type:complete